MRREIREQGRERFVLRVLEGKLSRSLEFDPDGTVVAVGAAVKDRDARVPGPSLHGHEGENFARAADEKVKRRPPEAK